MRRLPSIKAHGVLRDLPGGRLVHVIPDPGQAGLYETSIPFAPPASGAVGGKIRKNRLARPHLPRVVDPAVCLTKYVVFQAILVDRISRLELYPRIDNGHHSKSIFLELPEHTPHIGKRLLVPREHPVLVHILDIEPERVAGNLVFPVLAGQIGYHLLVVGMPSALVVSESPYGRSRHAAGEIAVRGNDGAQARTGKNILCVLSAGKVEPVLLGVLKFKVATVAIVDKEAGRISRILRKVVEEWDGHVVRIELRTRGIASGVGFSPRCRKLTRGIWAQHIGVPECVALAHPVHPACLFPQTKDGVFKQAFACNHELIVEIRVGAVDPMDGCRFKDCRSVRSICIDLKGSPCDNYGHAVCAQPDIVVALNEVEGSMEA